MRPGIIVAPAVSVVLLALSSRAGKLDDFESGSRRNVNSGYRTESNVHTEHGSSCLGDMFDILFSDVAGECLAYGGAASLARARGADGETDDWLRPRQQGDAALPVVRVDVAYRDVQSDVESVDLRVETGYGPAALHYDHAFYREDEPSDDLSIWRLAAVYRMSVAGGFEIDLGLGGMGLSGDRHRGAAVLMLPVLWHPYDWLGLEFRPAWGANVADYDAALLVGSRYLSFKAGYRVVDTTGESLNGPYAGLSVHF